VGQGTQGIAPTWTRAALTAAAHGDTIPAVVGQYGAMTSNLATSSATVATGRPARYGKQLAAHLGRRATSSWDEETGLGEIRFPFGQATLTAQGDALLLFVEGSADAEPELQGAAGLDRLEDVVGRHLVRFGTKDELLVRWQRSDGTPGTTQQLSEEPPAL
jgi:uncharacterized protein